MRAKRVPIKAVIFDFDETLVQTDAKIHIYKNNRKIKSITPVEFNSYIAKPGESFDFSDFQDPLLVLTARKYKMWNALERLYFKIENGQVAADIYILTARDYKIKDSIYTFLKRNGIIIPSDNIITVGGDNSEDVANRKKNELKELKKKYNSILFYDDSIENIKLAGEIGGIDTILVDWN